MADIEYAAGELTELANSLSSLAGALAKDSQLAGVGVDEVCCQTVVDALTDFAGNWDDRRDVLVKSLATVGDLAKGAAEAFAQADSELAEKIRAAVEVSS